MDWDKLANGAKNVLTKAGEYAQRERERLERLFLVELKKMSDQQIRNGLRNVSQDDWRYSLVEAEAQKRRIY